MRSRRPKKAAKADFGPNRAESGPPFGVTVGQILHFFEGLHFRQILGSKFRGVGGRIWPPVLCRSGRLNKDISSRPALLRSAANLQATASAADPSWASMCGCSEVSVDRCSDDQPLTRLIR